MQAAFAETRAKQQHPLADRPLVGVDAGLDSTQPVIDVHAALARLSSNSRTQSSRTRGTRCHLFQPAVVVQAIGDVLRAEREKRPLQ